MFLRLKSPFVGTPAFTYRAEYFCISKKFSAVDITKEMGEAKVGGPAG